MAEHKEDTKDVNDPSADATGDSSGATEDPTVTKDSEEISTNGGVKVGDDSLDKDSECKNGSTEPQIELTADEMKEKLKKFDDIFEKMKGCVFRTDISATEKVNQVKMLLIPPPEIEKPKHEENPGSLKRPADDGNDAPKPKVIKTGEDGGEGGEIGSDDEDRDIDSCVVCGLYLQVFKEDKSKELHHYLSHGFNILKEFDILKPDDSLFLCCALCGSVYPRKCHVNYRKHLVSDHADRIVEIFREI